MESEGCVAPSGQPRAAWSTKETRPRQDHRHGQDHPAQRGCDKLSPGSSSRAVGTARNSPQGLSRQCVGTARATQAGASAKAVVCAERLAWASGEAGHVVGKKREMRVAKAGCTRPGNVLSCTQMEHRGNGRCRCTRPSGTARKITPATRCT